LKTKGKNKAGKGDRL